MLNDLKDWRADPADKIVAGQDALTRRPTILAAFALEGADDAAAAALEEVWKAADLEKLRDLYRMRGAFEKAERLVESCRRRAQEEAEKTEPRALGELMRFVVETVL